MTALTFTPNGVQKSSLSNVIEEWFGNDLNHKRNFRNPATNIIEHDDKYIIELSVPGFSREAFEITADKNKLSVSSIKSEQETIENDTFTMREFEKYSFTKSFQLSNDIDTNNITAKCNNGILTIHLPKKDEAKTLPPKSIRID